ncbi:MAG: nitroreductase family protein, partial [Pseudomonadota bacterium]
MAEVDGPAFDALLAKRWSCRAFRPDPVPRAVIEAILTAAQRTASWNNVQPWQVTLLSGASMAAFRRKMVETARAGGTPEPHIPFPTSYEGVYKDRRRACGYQLYDAVGIARGDKPAYARQTLRNFEMFDAPHVAIITGEEVLGTYGVLDC